LLFKLVSKLLQQVQRYWFIRYFKNNPPRWQIPPPNLAMINMTNVLTAMLWLLQ